jgi:hypothetical protein
MLKSSIYGYDNYSLTYKELLQINAIYRNMDYRDCAIRGIIEMYYNYYAV